MNGMFFIDPTGVPGPLSAVGMSLKLTSSNATEARRMYELLEPAKRGDIFSLLEGYNPINPHTCNSLVFGFGGYALADRRADPDVQEYEGGSRFTLCLPQEPDLLRKIGHMCRIDTGGLILVFPARLDRDECVVLFAGSHCKICQRHIMVSPHVRYRVCHDCQLKQQLQPWLA